MANLNYAQVWEPELLEILIQGTLTSPFVTSNVKWLDAKTFHFTQMSTSGYKITAEMVAGTAEAMRRQIFRTH